MARHVVRDKEKLREEPWMVMYFLSTLTLGPIVKVG